MEYVIHRWATFVLSKNVFVKFTYAQPERGAESGAKPTGFCVLTLMWQTPYLVLIRFAFFGLRTDLQRKLVAEFTDDIVQLQDSKYSVGVAITGAAEPESSPPPLVVCQKPLARMLVRYEENEAPFSSRRSSSISVRKGSKATESSLRLVPNPTVTNYLRHRRWIL